MTPNEAFEDLLEQVAAQLSETEIGTIRRAFGAVARVLDLVEIHEPALVQFVSTYNDLPHDEQREIVQRVKAFAEDVGQVVH